MKMQMKFIFSLICLLFICNWVVAVDNPQGNNPVCDSCGSYGLDYFGPLEYTPYPEPLNIQSFNPGNIYVVYSVIEKTDRIDWNLQNAIWQAWGPYEFKAGKGYVLEFGPQDIVGMTEGPLPYYVEGTASWLQAENVDYFDENSYIFCIVSAERFEGLGGGEHTVPSSNEILILDIDTLGGVDNNPTGSVYLDLPKKTRVTKIQTYHWNYGEGTSSPGKILVIDLNNQLSDGGYETYEFNAQGEIGSGGAPNAYWVVKPDMVLEPGRYQIIDSDSSTWEQNADTGGRGVTKVWGIFEE